MQLKIEFVILRADRDFTKSSFRAWLPSGIDKKAQLCAKNFTDKKITGLTAERMRGEALSLICHKP